MTDCARLSSVSTTVNVYEYIVSAFCFSNAERLVDNFTQVSVWNGNGVQLSYTHADACFPSPNPSAYQLRTNSGIYSTPTAADLNGDGKIALVVGSSSTLGGPKGALFAWAFPNSSATLLNMPWPQFRHDARNTGVYQGDVIFKNGFD